MSQTSRNMADDWGEGMRSRIFKYIMDCLLCIYQRVFPLLILCWLPLTQQCLMTMPQNSLDPHCLWPSSSWGAHDRGETHQQFFYSSPFHSRCHQEIWYITLILLCQRISTEVLPDHLSREVWENLKYVLGILAWSILGSMLHRFP